jgi:hypothetical protein
MPRCLVPSRSQGGRAKTCGVSPPCPATGNKRATTWNLTQRCRLVPSASFARACDSLAACKLSRAAIGGSLWALRVMSLGTCAIFRPGCSPVAAKLWQKLRLHTLPHSTRFEVQTPSYAVTSGLKTTENRLASASLALSQHLRRVFLEFDIELFGPGMRSNMGLSRHHATGALMELRSQRRPKAPSDR